ncbi:MAG: hypothetical protein R6X13_06650, partial [bacterium]
FLERNGVPSRQAWKLSDNRSPSVTELILAGTVDCVVNVPKRSADEATLTDGYHIRRTAADVGVPLVNDAELARLFIRALLLGRGRPPRVRPLSEFIDR